MLNGYVRLGFGKDEIRAIIFAIAVVSLWRGVWGLMDLYLIPDNPTLSFTLSIIIGLVIIGITEYTVRELV
jgi:hypothetical protein